MNLSSWNPISVIVVLVIGLPSLTYAIIAIINAVKGNAAAAQQAADSMRGLAQKAALEALHQTGIPQQVTSLNAQVTDLAKMTPPPQVVVQAATITPPQEQPK